MVLSVLRQTRTRTRKSKHRWKDKFVGRHLRRIVDVDKVNTLRWCRMYGGPTSKKMEKRLKNPCGPTRELNTQLEYLEQGIRLTSIAEGSVCAGQKSAFYKEVERWCEIVVQS